MCNIYIFWVERKANYTYRLPSNKWRFDWRENETAKVHTYTSAHHHTHAKREREREKQQTDTEHTHTHAHIIVIITTAINGRWGEHTFEYRANSIRPSSSSPFVCVESVNECVWMCVCVCLLFFTRSLRKFTAYRRCTRPCMRESLCVYVRESDLLLVYWCTAYKLPICPSNSGICVCVWVHVYRSNCRKESGAFWFISEHCFHSYNFTHFLFFLHFLVSVAFACVCVRACISFHIHYTH